MIISVTDLIMRVSFVVVEEIRGK